MRVLPCLLLVRLFCGCGSDHSGGGIEGPDAAAPPVDSDPLSGLPTGTNPWSAVCAKHHGDMISARFCAGASPPSLTSLADVVPGECRWPRAAYTPSVTTATGST